MDATDRREFILNAAKVVGISLCTFAVGSLVQSCEVDVVKPASTTPTGETATLLLSEAPELNTVGGAVKRTFGSHNGGSPVIIIRLDATTFVAFSSVCTHKGTIIDLPTQGSNVMICPRHDEEFRITDGEPLTGTAPSALRSYPVSYSEGSSSITITF